MKKLILAALLINSTFFVEAQVVNIPDNNFRQALIDLGVDSNNDGEIQVSEAVSKTGNLNVSNKSIVDMTGIEAFVNITHLFCYSNAIDSLDVTQLTQLEVLSCYENSILKLKVSGLSSLNRLECYNNSLVNLNTTGLSNLEILNCFLNSLTSLDLRNSVNLTTLFCTGNSLTEIKLDGLSKLEYLTCNGNQLSTLNLNGLNKLRRLTCSTNNLTSLNLNDLPNLTNLSCSSNKLSNLDLSVQTQLIELSCSLNELTSLNVNDLAQLADLSCSHNQLTSLDITNTSSLRKLHCTNNKLTSLDISTSSMLEELDCRKNKIIALDLSGLTHLTDLICFDNLLISLIVGNNSLTKVYCPDNFLSFKGMESTGELAANVIESRNPQGLLFTEDIISLGETIDYESESIVLNQKVTFQWYRVIANGIDILEETNTTGVFTPVSGGKYYTRMTHPLFIDVPYLQSKNTTVNITTGISNISEKEQKTIVKAYDLSGQEIPIDTSGVPIIFEYNNGEFKLEFRLKSL